jgi:hypothetical protein
MLLSPCSVAVLKNHQTGNFFCYPVNRNINYWPIHLGKLSDYQLSDKGIDYRIIDYRNQKKTIDAQLWYWELSLLYEQQKAWSSLLILGPLRSPT